MLCAISCTQTVFSLEPGLKSIEFVSAWKQGLLPGQLDPFAKY
jgi:hypothetical protein